MYITKSILEEADKATSKKDIENLVDKLLVLLTQYSEDAELFRLRASLWVKLDEKGKAINDYNEVLRRKPNDQEALSKILFLETILRFNNSDIYANTNTNMDPWLE